MVLEPGTTVGPYEVVALVGAGGTGEVYRARDPRLGRDVAVKVLSPTAWREPERLRRFEKEAKAAGALNHPNVLAVYDIGTYDGAPYIVSELLAGETLRSRIGGAPLPLPKALDYAVQVARGLAAAHDKGIVHRDLKPDNLFVTKDGRIKILDFGLAKLEPDAPGPDGSGSINSAMETLPGTLLGTLGYMSPEQVQGDAADARSDIFSFGTVLYEMLTGRRAFKAPTAPETLVAILKEDPLQTAGKDATLAPGLERVLRHCLEKSPAERFQSAQDLAFALEALAGLMDDGTRAPVPAPGGRRWQGIGLGVLAAALAGVLGIALSSFWRPAADRSGSGGENPLAGARFTRVTSFEGSQFDAAISPDGRFVTFVSDRDRSADLFVGQIDKGEFRNLTQGLEPFEWQSEAAVRKVGFNGDGSEVWWFDDRAKPEVGVRMFPLLGGPMRNFLEERVINLAWSPDGKRIAYHTSHLGDPFYVADRNGRNSRLILGSPEGMHQHFPTWSVDGRWIYLTRGRQTTLEMDLWRVRPDGSELERLTRGKLNVRYPTPIDESTVLYCARDQDGAGPWLWALDLGTRISRRASVGLEQYGSVAASADRRRLVATVFQDPRAELWSVPILDVLATESDAEPFVLPTARARAPRFGGSSLFFLSSRGSGDGLWRYEDGRLTEIWRGSETALLEPAAVSPDGSSVVLLLRGDEGWHLNVLSADGTRLRLLSEAVDARGAAAWSPDGRWVVTEGSEEGGVIGLYKIPVAGGAPERLVDGEAMDPVWSPDGNLIFYCGPQVAGNSPVLAVRRDGEPVDLPETIEVDYNGEPIRFLPDGSGLVYLRVAEASPGFWLLDLTTMRSRQLAQLDAGATVRAFDITPDGQRIVFDRLHDDSNIVLIELRDRATERQATSLRE